VYATTDRRDAQDGEHAVQPGSLLSARSLRRIGRARKKRPKRRVGKNVGARARRRSACATIRTLSASPRPAATVKRSSVRGGRAAARPNDDAAAADRGRRRPGGPRWRCSPAAIGLYIAVRSDLRGHCRPVAERSARVCSRARCLPAPTCPPRLATKAPSTEAQPRTVPFPGAIATGSPGALPRIVHAGALRRRKRLTCSSCHRAARSSSPRARGRTPRRAEHARPGDRRARRRPFADRPHRQGHAPARADRRDARRSRAAARRGDVTRPLTASITTEPDPCGSSRSSASPGSPSPRCSVRLVARTAPLRSCGSRAGRRALTGERKLVRAPALRRARRARSARDELQHDARCARGRASCAAAADSPTRSHELRTADRVASRERPVLEDAAGCPSQSSGGYAMTSSRSSTS